MKITNSRIFCINYILNFSLKFKIHQFTNFLYKLHSKFLLKKLLYDEESTEEKLKSSMNSTLATE
jgi:hypothetical protein